jgi:hypothetical protein
MLLGVVVEEMVIQIPLFLVALVVAVALKLHHRLVRLELLAKVLQEPMDLHQMQVVVEEPVKMVTLMVPVQEEMVFLLL